MRYITLVLILLAGVTIAGQNQYSARLNYMGTGDVNVLGVNVESSRATQVLCHCVGGYSPLPEFEIVSMNTGERLYSGACSNGPNDAQNTKEVILPQRRIRIGESMGVKITNAPRPIREAGHPFDFHVCVATVKMKSGF